MPTGYGNIGLHLSWWTWYFLLPNPPKLHERIISLRLFPKVVEFHKLFNCPGGYLHTIVRNNFTCGVYHNHHQHTSLFSGLGLRLYWNCLCNVLLKVQRCLVPKPSPLPVFLFFFVVVFSYSLQLAFYYQTKLMHGSEVMKRDNWVILHWEQGNRVSK